MTHLQYTDLVIRCTACNGDGYVEIGTEELPCSECDGTGQRLTEAGKVIYRLVQPLIERAIEVHEFRYHRRELI